MFIFRKTTGLVLVSLLLSLVGVIGSSGTAYATLGTNDYPYASYDGPGSNPAGSYWTDSNGNPASPYGFYYRNCTDFVAWRLNNDNKFTGLPHGIGTGATSWGDWAKSQQPAGTYPVNSTPAAGAVAWWAAGTLDNGYTIGSSGHVAYVDSVNSDGVTANIEEYNYGGTGQWHTRSIAIGPKQQVQYIHFKDLSATPPPSPPWTGVGNATFLGNQLTDGQQMHGNQYIMSPDGRFVLMMESGGNLAEYTANVTSPIWSTGTGGNSGAWLGVQSDGNVVLYSASGSALWSTGALGITKFVVQDDENVVGYNSAGQAAWNAGKTTNSYGWNWRGSDSLTTGMTMVREQYIRSSDGRYITVMQDDGNLVVYGPGQTLLWNSGTPNNPGAYIVVQSDGNVVMYNSAGTTSLWSTGQYNIGRLTIQSNSDLVGYSSVNTTQWVMGSYVGNPWPGVGNATYVGNQLTNGQQLHSNQYIMSNNGWFVLMMQPDGNLVEYNALGRIWDAATNNNPGAWLGVQSDGNVVIYSASGTALWSTGQQGITKLAVQDDENVVGYNSSGTATWDSGIGVNPPLGLTYTSDTLTAGATLTSGHYLRSADGRYFALMQTDGNFVVYAPGYRGLVSTQTGGSAGAYLTIQGDGNMVVYASNGTTALWSTGQKGITKLVMQSDGNLVAFNGAGTPVWYTGTTGAT